MLPSALVPDLLLMAGLGFLGSFGHCASMCGPVTVAFGLATGSNTAASSKATDPTASASTAQADAETTGQGSRHQSKPSVPTPSLFPGLFHSLLNLGRLLSYAMVGAAIGGLGEVLLAGGQLAGVGSELRRWMAISTGGLLIWLGLVQIAPGLLPNLPILKLAQQQHERLSRLMVRLSLAEQTWTPLLLGLCWGMIPCGFLYTAQIRAVEVGSWWGGALLMLAFGLGTTPTMVGIGWVASRWTGTGQTQSKRRSQLAQLGGWVTLATGLLLLLRRGDSHGSGAIAYGGLFLLMLALVARPLAQLQAAAHAQEKRDSQEKRESSPPSSNQLQGITVHLTHWLARSPGPALLRYRRGLGVGAFILVLVHVLQVFSLNWNWNWQTVNFLIPQHRQGVALGIAAFLLMLPAAVTSFDRYQQGWGKLWRRIHLLTLPALGLSWGHTLLLAGGYWLPGQANWEGIGATVLLSSSMGVVLLLRTLPLRRVKTPTAPDTVASAEGNPEQ